MMRWYPLICFSALFLASCSSIEWDPTASVGAGKGHVAGERAETPSSNAAGSGIPAAPLAGDAAEKPLDEPPRQRRYSGNGRFVAEPAKRIGQGVPAEAGDITLNFENTDVREVVKVILGDLLDVNYVLDPGVAGAVTMQTGRPISRGMLLPTLETLLRMNNAALVDAGDMYRVMPVSKAIRGNLVPQLGENRRPLPKGYAVRIVPLQYIGVAEMSKILQPLAPDGSILRMDPVRNLLVIAGSSPELGSLLDTIDMFDVDWMKGLSVGMFRLEYSKVQDVMAHLNTLLGAEQDNPLAGLFRVIPVESTNSLLVITHQERYLNEIATWIERLDQGEGENKDVQQLYVYRVKHGNAADLADIISQLFAGESERSRTVARVAPGLSKGGIASKAKSASPSPDGRGPGASAGSVGKKTLAVETSSSSSYNLESGISIVADSVNNSLLVRATPAQYRSITDALDKLDILPLQVLVEATIVEVLLTGELEYGLQWFFKAQTGDKTSLFEFDGNLDGNDSGIGKIFPGFNWSLIEAVGDVRAILSAFAGKGLVNVLSSPSVMVLDNRTARIQVGDQVPVATSQQQGTSVDDRVVNSIEFRDTGVMLAVTPRVTPGGLVIMDVEQEVSNAVETTVSSLDSPTIQTRTISSSVAVMNQQAVVLGGLIRDRSENSGGGVPGLHTVPGVGWLFGQKSKKAERIELVVILTPTVIAGKKDIEKVNQDYKRRLKSLEGKF